MAASVYQINKGVNKSIEFRGLKAQYIWYLAGGLIGLLILFALLYVGGVNTYICLFIILVAGAVLFVWIYRLSNRYGEYGMMKKAARRLLPRVIKNNSRTSFINYRNRYRGQVAS